MVSLCSLNVKEDESEVCMSVNSWQPLLNDHYDRFKESIVRFLVLPPFPRTKGRRRRRLPLKDDDEAATAGVEAASGLKFNLTVEGEEDEVTSSSSSSSSSNERKSLSIGKSSIEFGKRK